MFNLGQIFELPVICNTMLVKIVHVIFLMIDIFKDLRRRVDKELTADVA
jgi:hypothetical protein